MSYILEALKKSEQERQLGHVPDISVAQAPPVRPAQRWSRWLAAALVVNALVLGLLVWRPWTPPPVSETPSVSASKAAPTAAQPVAEPANPPRVEFERPDTPAADLPAPVASRPVPAPVEARPESLEDRPSSGDDVPRWEDLSAEMRAGLPVPRIDVHVFAREPARRFVLINLRKHREGDAVDGGARIEAILHDGVVLSHQGQRYRVGRP